MSENENPKVHFPKALKELNKTKAFDRKQSFLGSHTVTWVLGQPKSNKQRDVVSQRSVHDCSPTPEMILYLNFFILLFAKINFCLFIFGCAGSLLLHIGFSNCREQGLLFLWCVGFSWRWLLLLQSTGSRCSVACGIFLDLGSNSCSLHWQVDSYLLYHQGSP